jgi:heparosan-N-sulfate-glucuronate 5-epimerase
MKLHKKFFMLQKLITDLKQSSIPFKPNEDNKSEKLGYYYFRFEEDFKHLNRLIAHLDQDGIPLNTTYIDVAKKKLHYYPISIGQYGLALFHSYLNTNSTDKHAHFLRIADWFVKNAKHDNRLGAFWLTDVSKPEYHVFSPWKSAFAQSRALSILLRAWQLTAKIDYYTLACRALEPFCFDIRDGGVTANLHEQRPFYEEYAAAEPTMVLDGHIFALFGLFDFVRCTRKINDKSAKKARELFEQGIDSLIGWLPEYDLNYWVRFNLCRMAHYPAIDPCTVGYLHLVVEQLKILADITDRTELTTYATKFENYDRSRNILRMYRVKYQAMKQLNRI